MFIRCWCIIYPQLILVFHLPVHNSSLCWVSTSMTSSLISFIALYFSTSFWVVSSHAYSSYLCVGFLFSMLILFPLSFSSSFHFKTDHIFPFNFFLKLLSFSFTKMVIPLRGQRKFSLLFLFPEVIISLTCFMCHFSFTCHIPFPLFFNGF